MSTMYVLVRIGYEYNDEIYYNRGGSGGEPVKVFHDKKLAHLYCQKKNIDELKKEEIGHYCYSLDEIDNGGMEDFLKSVGVDISDSWDISLRGLTDEQLEKVYELTSLRFYDVIEVDDVLPPDLIKQAVEDGQGASS